MSVRTDFDEKRDELSEKIKEAYTLARELYVGDHIWGYEEMSSEYVEETILEVIGLLKKARDKA